MACLAEACRALQHSSRSGTLKGLFTWELCCRRRCSTAAVRGLIWKTWGVATTISSQTTPTLHMSYGQVRFTTGLPLQYLWISFSSFQSQNICFYSDMSSLHCKYKLRNAWGQYRCVSTLWRCRRFGLNERDLHCCLHFLLWTLVHVHSFRYVSVMWLSTQAISVLKCLHLLLMVE